MGLQHARVLIGVGGRFHSDYLYHALSGEGFHTKIASSLPQRCFKTVPPAHVSSYPLAELAFRLGRSLGLEAPGDHLKMKWFGNFLSKEISNFKPHTVFGWSSFSKEAFLNHRSINKILIRDSTHIVHQYEVLKKEYAKEGRELPHRDFCIERELIEYEACDKIVVLSQHARATFIQQGIQEKKLLVVPLGVDTRLFQRSTPLPSHSGPLKIVYFGSISRRKGMGYLFKAIKNLKHIPFELLLIGEVEEDLTQDVLSLPYTTHLKAVPQSQLRSLLENQEVFLFPTIEDGFGQTLPQALSLGLYPIVTSYCGAVEPAGSEPPFHVMPSLSEDLIGRAIEDYWQDRKAHLKNRAHLIEISRKYDWSKYTALMGTLAHNRSPSDPSFLNSSLELSEGSHLSF